ncbi:MAG: hypothetical protein BV459_01810 [Thermoplasmata archaeon M11B2D]|nr:MAG: hypothetical protein BV459_01810 [Thermoplasmata archaeon M11B2D]
MKIKNRTETLSDKAQSNPFKKTVLQYPLENSDREGRNHFVRFDVNVTKNTKFYQDTANDNVDGGLSRDNIKTFTSGGQARSRSNNVGFRSTTKRIDESIIMYMPNLQPVSYGVDWNQGEVGLVSDIVAGALQASDFLKNDSATETLINMVKANASNVSRAAAGGVAHLTQALGLTQAEDVLQSLTREVRNQHAEMLFKGTRNRRFSFDFKFTPRSKKETEEVLRIIERFKFHHSPELAGSDGTSGAFWIYPSEFEIRFVTIQDGVQVENPYINKISVCALTDISVNYSGATDFNTFDDGSPVNIDLQLSFTELELLTKKHILQGY